VSTEDEDVWARRRRLGEMLRRWARPGEPARSVERSADPAQADIPEPKDAGTSGGRARSDASEPNDAGWPAGPTRSDAAEATLRRAMSPPAEGAGVDRGAATIFVLAVGLVLVSSGIAGAAVGSARIGRHRAQAAADLGALAGAAQAIEGTEAACGRAARFVAANSGRVTSCEVHGLEIVVRTEVTITPLPGLTRHVEAAARAGPVYAWP
jgi:secretion/DNA translocation related TadE-like protein